MHTACGAECATLLPEMGCDNMNIPSQIHTILECKMVWTIGRCEWLPSVFVSSNLANSHFVTILKLFHKHGVPAMQCRWPTPNSQWLRNDRSPSNRCESEGSGKEGTNSIPTDSSPCKPFTLFARNSYVHRKWAIKLWIKSRSVRLSPTVHLYCTDPDFDRIYSWYRLHAPQTEHAPKLSISLHKIHLEIYSPLILLVKTKFISVFSLSKSSRTDSIAVLMVATGANR